MGDTVQSFLLNLSSKTDLSPKGFIAMLNFIHDMIALEQKPFMQKIFKVRSFDINVIELPETVVFPDERQSVAEYSGMATVCRWWAGCFCNDYHSNH